jgi:hypothetical protein
MFARAATMSSKTIAACFVFWVPFISLSLWMGMVSGEIWGVLKGLPYWRAPVPSWTGKACWIAFICFILSLFIGIAILHYTGLRLRDVLL